LPKRGVCGNYLTRNIEVVIAQANIHWIPNCHHILASWVDGRERLVFFEQTWPATLLGIEVLIHVISELDPGNNLCDLLKVEVFARARTS
jgi:hypothetical protein